MPSKALLYSILLLLSPSVCLAVDMGEIHSAETRTGTLAFPSQTDTFSFDGVTGTGVVILLSKECSDSAFNPEVRLLQPETQDEEASDWGGSSAEIENHRLQRTGVYTILVKELHGDATCDYSLSLLLMPGATTSTVDADGGQILSAETAEGSISLNADTDAFSFSGAESSGVLVVLARECTNAAFNPEVRLYGPNGLREASDWGGSSAEIENRQLQETGIYTIVVKELHGDTTCDYNLSLILMAGPTISVIDPDGGRINSGESKTGRIDRNSDTDAYALAGQAGENVFIALSRNCPDSAFNPEVRLYDPDGLRETSDWGGTSAEIDNHELLKTGIYTIVAKELHGDTTCEYSVSLTKIPPGAVLSCAAAAAPMEPTSTVLFEASVSGGTSPYSYHWSFGDGSRSLLSSPTYTYGVGGIFAWYLIVYDSTGQGCVDHGFVSIGSMIFDDGFETGDTSAWSSTEP